MLRPGQRLLLGLALLLLGAGAGAETFPMPAALAPRVDFWTRVYSEVGTHGGLIHDNGDLSLVYEVIRLPEGSSSGAVQRASKRAKSRAQAALRKLGAGRRSGLSDYESRVLSLFPNGVPNATLQRAAGNVRFQLGQADKFRDGLRRMGQWEGFIRRTLRERSVPEDLVALPHVESSFNPKAYSHAGASGLWQFTRGTGRLYMRVDHVVDERRDPWLSSVAAARLLKSNHESLQTWPLAITAYNHGSAGMKRAVRQLGTRDIGRITDRYKSRSFGFASRNFYSEFLAARRVDRDAERYFGAIRKDGPVDPEIVPLDHYYRVASLTRELQIPVSTLRDFNPALMSPVWSGQKFVPRGYDVRLPRRADKPVGKVMLANVPGSERFREQTIDRRYRVKPGDTLGRIARRHRVKESELVAVNNLRNRHFLRVGQWLEIPTKGPARGRSAAPAVAREPVPADGLYRVRPGDSLDRIADRFGVDRRDLQAKNRIRNANRIHVGQVLEIPGGARSAAPGEAGVYTVRKGDTLHGIARRFGVSEQEIARLNGLKSRHRIQVGQILHVPGAGAQAAPKPASEPAPPPPAAVAVAEPKPDPAPEPAEAAALIPAPAPAAGSHPGRLPLAPERYAVDARGGIRVQPDETLGHYAEWLGTSAQRLRSRNGLRSGRALPLGARLELDFQHVSSARFEQSRLAHHRAIQQRFFAAYRVEGARDHVVRKGETLWKLSRGPEPIPVWLLHDYNPGLDLASLRAGQKVRIPNIRPRT